MFGLFKKKKIVKTGRRPGYVQSLRKCPVCKRKRKAALSDGTCASCHTHTERKEARGWSMPRRIEGLK